MDKTVTYTREHGTQVTIPATAQDRIAAIRAIVKEKQYAKIDGCMIDLFTATVIVKVYDALSETAKAKYASYKAGQMGTIAFRLLEKQ